MERLGHLIEEVINQKRWKTSGLSRRGSNLFHLFFANDLMLFCEGKASCCGVECYKSVLLLLGTKGEQKEIPSLLFCQRP